MPSTAEYMREYRRTHPKYASKNRDDCKRYYHEHKEEHKNYQRKWRDEHREYYNAKQSENNFKRKYGITFGDYNILGESQRWRCAICKKKLNNENCVVDHDHNTGIVRGLLCRQCNTGIGQLKDDVKLLQSAISYLQAAM